MRWTLRVLVGLVGCVEPTQWRPEVVLLDAASPGVHGLQWVEVTSPEATPVTLQVDDGVRTWSVPTQRVAKTHVLPLLGLAAGREVSVVARAPSSRESAPQRFVVPPFPDAVPVVEILAHEPAEVEPGLLLFGLRANDEDVPSAIVVLDEDLVPVLWIEAEPPVGDLRIGPRGQLVGLVAGDLMEWDLCGTLSRHIGPSPYAEVPLDVPDGLHHEGYPLEDGTYVALSSELRAVDAYPDSYDDPQPAGAADVRDQLAVRFDADGRVLERISLVDVLDTARISFDSLQRTPLGADWAHANGLAVDPRDGGWVISARHQDALVKVHPDGALAWILGDPAGWRSPWADRLLETIGGADWAYHHHAPELLPDGTLIVFDNHNNGRTPYDGEPLSPVSSRAVAWRVDDVAGTAEHLWTLEQTATGPLYAAVVGDADYQPLSGNILRNYGILRDEPGGASRARVVEQHPSRPDDVLLDIRVSLPSELAPSGVNMWRVEKIPNLYPVDPSEVCLPPSAE